MSQQPLDWIIKKLGKRIRAHLSMNLKNYGDPLTLYLAPPSSGFF